MARAAADEPTSEVPFSFEKGHVIVHAKIKDEVSVEVILSTGAEHSTVDMGLLEKYKLPGGYAGEPPVTGHNDRIYFFSSVPDVRVGEAKAKSLTMRFVSLSEVSKAVGREIFGVWLWCYLHSTCDCQSCKLECGSPDAFQSLY